MAELNSSVHRKSTRKSPAVKNAVVAKRLAGEGWAQISRDLGISKNTVKNIVHLTDIDRLMEDGRIGAMERVPKALKTLDNRLEKHSESAALWLLDKCFDSEKKTGAKMAGDLTLNQTLNVLLRGNSPETAENPPAITVETVPSTDK